MEDEIRRSSRTTKGKHTGRAETDVYYVAQDGAEGPALKKARKTDDSVNLNDVHKHDDKSAENEGQVRCDGCETTDENYDEETDEGGMMIECEHCQTWQHARCMGYATKKQIPKVYLCNRCEETETKDEGKKSPQNEVKSEVKESTPEVKSELKSEPKSESKPVAQPVVQPVAVKTPVLTAKAAQQAKTRANVAKALVNVIVRANSGLCEAEKWGQLLEEALYTWAGATDKKYIEKSRSVMALVKKPAVLARLISHELSPADFTLLPVEDIDPDLKNYAEKVRQELIRRSVLTVNDDLSQRIRRTHKGEEVVETKNDENNDDVGVSLMARHVDHRKFKSEAAPTESMVVVTPSGNNHNLLTSNLYQLGDDDDEYDHEPVHADGDGETNENGNENGEDHGAGNDALDGVSDDELDFILKAKTPKKTAPISVPKPAPVKKAAAPALPPTMPTEFWAGEIVFPDVATFGVLADFVACTNYQRPKDNITASFHNKAVRVCKELLERRVYLIEGRLDRSRADPYLEQIVKSRDLYLVKLRKEDPSYSKVYDYLRARNKVGVLSDRASMVKDAYLFALSHDAPSYMDFATVGEGLYVLFSVKKDYVPVGKSILKKLRVAPKPSLGAGANLDNILLKLEGSMANGNGIVPGPGPAHLPQRPHQYAPPVPAQVPGPNMPTQLSQDQMSYLSSIVQQNPHVQSDPQALLNLLQLMQT